MKRQDVVFYSSPFHSTLPLETGPNEILEPGDNVLIMASGYSRKPGIVTSVSEETAQVYSLLHKHIVSSRNYRQSDANIRGYRSSLMSKI